MTASPYDDPKYVQFDRGVPFPGRQPTPRFQLTATDLREDNLRATLRRMEPGESFQITRWPVATVRALVDNQLNSHAFAVAPFGDGYRCWRFQA